MYQVVRLSELHERFHSLITTVLTGLNNYVTDLFPEAAPPWGKDERVPHFLVSVKLCRSLETTLQISLGLESKLEGGREGGRSKYCNNLRSTSPFYKKALYLCVCVCVEGGGKGGVHMYLKKLVEAASDQEGPLIVRDAQPTPNQPPHLLQLSSAVLPYRQPPWATLGDQPLLQFPLCTLLRQQSNREGRKVRPKEEIEGVEVEGASRGVGEVAVFPIDPIVG